MRPIAGTKASSDVLSGSVERNDLDRARQRIRRLHTEARFSRRIHPRGFALHACWAADAAGCWAADAAPCWTPDAAPCWTPDAAPCWTPDAAPCWTPDAAPCWTPDAAPCWTL